MGNNIILQKTIEFSTTVIRIGERLQREKNFILSNQLVRAGTAIGAMVHEAQSSESRLDFLHKLKIADKEANETMYWITLLEKTDPVFDTEIRKQLMEIRRLLGSIIVTCRKKLNEKPDPKTF
jgi:four helix bundle protein